MLSPLKPPAGHSELSKNGYQGMSLNCLEDLQTRERAPTPGPKLTGSYLTSESPINHLT